MSYDFTYFFPTERYGDEEYGEDIIITLCTDDVINALTDILYEEFFLKSCKANEKEVKKGIKKILNLLDDLDDLVDMYDSELKATFSEIAFNSFRE